MRVTIVGRRVVDPYVTQAGIAKPGGIELNCKYKKKDIEGFCVESHWVKGGSPLFTQLSGPLPLPVDAELEQEIVKGRNGDFAVLSDVRLILK